MGYEGYEASVQNAIEYKETYKCMHLMFNFNFNLTITLTIIWSHDNLKHLIS